MPKNKLGVIVLTSAIGSPVGFYAEKAADLLVPAIASATGKTTEVPGRNPELNRFVGIYDSSWGQAAVIHWQGGLAIMDLDSRDPKESISKLSKTGENTFRRVRKDDESLGEEFVFEIDESGAVTRFMSHSNWMTKVQ